MVSFQSSAQFTPNRIILDRAKQFCLQYVKRLNPFDNVQFQDLMVDPHKTYTIKICKDIHATNLNRFMSQDGFKITLVYKKTIVQVSSDLLGEWFRIDAGENNFQSVPLDILKTLFEKVHGSHFNPEEIHFLSMVVIKNNNVWYKIHYIYEKKESLLAIDQCGKQILNFYTNQLLYEKEWTPAHR